jgi:hypothetical protein
MTGHDAQRASRVAPINTKPCCRQLARQNWPAFAHMGATGATAPAGGRTGDRVPPAARVRRRGRQFGAWVHRLGGGTRERALRGGSVIACHGLFAAQSSGCSRRFPLLCWPQGQQRDVRTPRPGALPPDGSEPARRWSVEDRASFPMGRSSNSGEIAQ